MASAFLTIKRRYWTLRFLEPLIPLTALHNLDHLTWNSYLFYSVCRFCVQSYSVCRTCTSLDFHKIKSTTTIKTWALPDSHICNFSTNLSFFHMLENTSSFDRNISQDYLVLFVLKPHSYHAHHSLMRTGIWICNIKFIQLDWTYIYWFPGLWVKQYARHIVQHRDR